jgi:mannitol-1-phosphate/altronate dehydrogenase
MDNPGAWHLKQMVQKINEIGQRGSGDPSVDDYLRALASDPTTKWFTELLREKTAELAKERQRADRLSGALRAWYRAKQATAREQSAEEAELQLINLLHVMGILKP